MRARRYLAVPALALLVLCSFAATRSGSPTRSASRPTAAEVHEYTARVEENVANVRRLETAEWYQAAQEADVARFLEAVQAQKDADAAAAARPSHQIGPAAPSGGACRAPADTGTPPPAGFPQSSIDRESHGNVNASNGTHEGRAQLADSHFCGGGCTGMSYAACWDKLWAGGAGRSNWAQTMP